MPNKGNINNLKLIRTTEEARERGRNGGIASGKAKRKRKAMAEAADALLSLKVKDPKVIAKLEKMGIKAKDMNNQMAMLVGQLIKATNGDTRAAEYLTNLVGENPNKVEIDAEIKENPTHNATLEALMARKIDGIDDE
ncbi:MAG: hypothetical protein NC182_01680 [Prevotella sp.]|nr:hypothetical protein [Staphylococcus sp.]MCM1349893.1 hypothetical protein [Prevotella sp.]